MERFAVTESSGKSMRRDLALSVAARPRAASDSTDTRFRADLHASVGPAYRLACVILGNDAEAEDATQDALERAWRGRRSLRDADRFEAWFQRILVNACRDRVRRRRSRPIVLSLGDGGDAANLRPHVGTDPFAASLAQDAIRRGFARLNADQRAVVAMRFYLDLGVDEIARRLGTRQGTVKSRLHRALNILRESWEGDR
jgi:RNA polymerase sigma-70 factor (ECF subfamily)